MRFLRWADGASGRDAGGSLHIRRLAFGNVDGHDCGGALHGRDYPDTANRFHVSIGSIWVPERGSRSRGQVAGGRAAWCVALGASQADHFFRLLSLVLTHLQTCESVSNI